MVFAQFLKSNHPTAFSFEVLPPVRGKSIKSLYRDIDRLMPYAPSYINITTHRTEITYREVSAGVFQRTATRMRPGSVAIAAALRGRYGIPTVPHLICSGFSCAEIENELIDLQYLGITDLLLLRGDRARGENCFTAVEGGPEHALELCRQVEAFNDGHMVDGSDNSLAGERFTYGVAGYPEKHDEAMNLQTDLQYLKAKIDAGAQYVVTQMFFDNRRYFDFVERCRAAQITVPIIPGLKPLTALSQQTLLPKVFHIDFPDALAAELEKCSTGDDVKRLGVEWGIQQARELRAAGVPSLHFYSMSAAASVEEIARAVF